MGGRRHVASSESPIHCDEILPKQAIAPMDWSGTGRRFGARDECPGRTEFEADIRDDAELFGKKTRGTSSPTSLRPPMSQASHPRLSDDTPMGDWFGNQRREQAGPTHAFMRWDAPPMGPVQNRKEVLGDTMPIFDRRPSGGAATHSGSSANRSRSSRQTQGAVGSSGGRWSEWWA